MKSFTDIEQSKQLAETLPLESADMYYEYVLPRSNKLKHIPSIGNPVEALEWYNKGYTHFGKEPLSLKEYCIPCWSLAALLGVLDYEIVNKVGISYFLNIYKEYNQYQLCYRYELDNIGEYDIWTDSYDEFVDACYEMILKLKEKNLL